MTTPETQEDRQWGRVFFLPPDRLGTVFILYDYCLNNQLDTYASEQADFVDAAPFGGPLYDQLVYEPTVCTADQGIAADGTVRWTRGNARYVTC